MDNENLPSKICVVCHASKPLGQFQNRTAAKDGKDSYCYACRRAKRLAWNTANAEHIKQRNAAYHREHVDEHKMRSTIYSEKNKEQIKARMKIYGAQRREHGLTWNQRYPEKSREYNKKWYESHTDEVKAYRNANKQKRSHQNKVWNKAHPESNRERTARRRAHKANSPVNDFSAAQWIEVLAVAKGRCAYCPDDCLDCRYKRHKLTPDHVTPYAHNGSNTLWNIVACCLEHNSGKRDKLTIPKPVQPLLLTVAPMKKPRTKKSVET